MTFGSTLEKVLNGTQTQIRRPVGQRYVYLAGKVYGVQTHLSKESIAFIKVTSVKEQLLGAVTDAEAKAEGYNDLDAFKAAWIKSYGAFEPTDDVWKIEFKLIDRSELSSYSLYKLDRTRRKKKL